MMYNLNDIEKEIKRVCDEYCVIPILFGSRIYGTPYKFSDLDIALIGETGDCIDAMDDLYEEVNSAIKFDILHLSSDIKKGILNYIGG